jgi:hypothetical protein
MDIIMKERVSLIITKERVSLIITKERVSLPMYYILIIVKSTHKKYFLKNKLKKKGKNK